MNRVRAEVQYLTRSTVMGEVALPANDTIEEAMLSARAEILPRLDGLSGIDEIRIILKKIPIYG